MCQQSAPTSSPAVTSSSLFIAKMNLLGRAAAGSETRNLFFGKQKRDGETQSPVGSAVGAVHVIAIANLEGDGLFADFHQLLDREVHGHRPLVCLPIAGGLRVHPERGIGLGGVGDEGLNEGGVDLLTAPAADGPDVVGQDAVGETVRLLQCHHGGTRAPHATAQGRIGRGGIITHRPGAQNPPAHRFLGREEKALRDVAQTGMTFPRTRGSQRILVQRILVNDRHDGADDEVPIRADGDRHDRLDVAGVFHRAGRADAEVPIVLEGHADEVGDGILEFFGQLGLFVLRSCARAAAGGSSVFCRGGELAVEGQFVLGAGG